MKIVASRPYGGVRPRCGAQSGCRAVMSAALVAGLSLAPGCARVPKSQSGALAAASESATCNAKKDREAVLAMAGGYEVKFEFIETVPLVASYELRPAYRVEATEKVVVAEDTPSRIVLQHILALGQDEKRRGMKHWTQVWTYQAPDVLEYRGTETWVKRRLTNEQRRCAWTQQVFGIEDAPRYGSWGRWVHRAGVSTWTSEETWRPLPRRELKRGDYDVIVGTNRHTITPAGWVHEQDNEKLVLRGKNERLVRERGVIPYNRSTTQDFTAVDKFWQENAEFWSRVRQGWQNVLNQRERLAFLPSEKTRQSLNDDSEELLEQTKSKSITADEQRRLVETMIRGHLEPESRLANNVGPAER